MTPGLSKYITTAVLFLLSAQISYAQEIKWKHFKHKYGYEIDLPAIFSTGYLTKLAIQYYENTLDEGIEVNVETMGDASPKLHLETYELELKNYPGASLKIFKDNWFVISGEMGSGIYYLKEFMKGGQTFILTVYYPQEYKAMFDTALGRISKSFK